MTVAKFGPLRRRNTDGRGKAGFRIRHEQGPGPVGKVVALGLEAEGLLPQGSYAGVTLRPARSSSLTFQTVRDAQPGQLLTPADDDYFRMWPVSKRIYSSRAPGDDFRVLIYSCTHKLTLTSTDRPDVRFARWSQLIDATLYL